jgi:hypothetical protein
MKAIYGRFQSHQRVIWSRLQGTIKSCTDRVNAVMLWVMLDGSGWAVCTAARFAAVEVGHTALAKVAASVTIKSGRQDTNSTFCCRHVHERRRIDQAAHITLSRRTIGEYD